MKNRVDKFGVKIFMVFMFVVFVLAVPMHKVNAENTDVGSAKAITFGTSYNDTITESIEQRLYKITLQTSGRIEWSIEADIRYFDMYIYDSNNKKMYSGSKSRNSVTNRANMNDSMDLTAGVYYIQISETYGGNTGSYNFVINYTASGETFSESGAGSNNDIRTANSIAFGNLYTAQLAANDHTDFFRFEFGESGTVAFVGEGDIRTIDYIIYDAIGNKLYHDSKSRDSVTNRATLNTNYYLQKGTYFLEISDTYNYNTGVIPFRLLFASAGETFGETGADDTIQGANPIKYNINYSGQLAVNHNDKDYYAFTVSGNKVVAVDFVSEMTNGEVNIYDTSGKSQGYMNFNSTANITKSDIWQLSSGTYYLCVSSNNKCGNYSFKISTVSVPKKVTLSSVKSKKKRKMTVKWKKVSGANGYEMQYAYGKTFYYPHTYTVKGKSKTIGGLTSKNRYYVRVRAYKLIGNNKIYGAWSKVKSVKIK